MTKELSVYEKTKNLLMHKDSMEQFTRVFGNPDTAQKYVISAVQHIRENKDLHVCTPHSLKQAVVSAGNMKLAIDSRQHAHIVRFKDQATLMIGWRGFVAKIKESNPTADIQVGLIWKGDTLEIERENGVAKYKHKACQAFRSDYDKIIGGYCYISYIVGGVQKAVIETMDDKEISKIKNSAKQSYIWDKWYGEQVKKTLIRRASKLSFANAVADLERIDNENYEPIKKEPVKTTYEETPGMPEEIKSTGIAGKTEEVGKIGNTDKSNESKATETPKEVATLAEVVNPEQQEDTRPDVDF